MLLSKKVLYMLLGGVLSLALVFGAYVTFAQTGDGETAVDENSESNTLTPWPQWGGRGHRGFMEAGPQVGGVDEQELLANALGITVAELQAAQSAVRTALIEQAVADGLITQEQADQLKAFPGLRGRHPLPGLGAGEHLALLAEELGISQEALQAALDEVQAAKLAALVEAGVITQEQADTIAAYHAVQGYVDYEALSESVKSFFSAAIEQALADGVITQAQAEQMLQNLTNLNMRGFPGGRMMPGMGMPGMRMPGMGGRGHGGHGWFEGCAPGSSNAPATTLESSGA